MRKPLPSLFYTALKTPPNKLVEIDAVLCIISSWCLDWSKISLFVSIQDARKQGKRNRLSIFILVELNFVIFQLGFRESCDF